MEYKVYLTQDAYSDLSDLYNYILEVDSEENADYVLSKIESTFSRLAELPERGHYPRELKELGIKDYREVLFKPYRIIYRVIKKHIYIYCIADARRDLNDLLSKRLL
ncbi:hypothetical protein MNBD_GAMMA21-1051 [hydrothermal vent metagenome]|uniref:Death on curing protein, Doc toxin n=1 Tax=hydrothermal vent metagenome TaxID=652676 RepID=A0A3B1A4Q8_9ZZZZ